MARNWLFIANTQIIELVTQENTPTPNQCANTYDTLAIDDSGIFKVGDTFTVDLQLQYNANNWIEIGWLPNTYFETVNTTVATVLSNNSVLIDGVTYYANT